VHLVSATVELALQQLERFIAGMRPDDREAAIASFRGVHAALSRYENPFSGGALVKVVSSALVAHAGGTMDRWKARLVEKAKATGPYVDAIFSAL